MECKYISITSVDSRRPTVPTNRVGIEYYFNREKLKMVHSFGSCHELMCERDGHMYLIWDQCYWLAFTLCDCRYPIETLMERRCLGKSIVSMTQSKLRSLIEFILISSMDTIAALHPNGCCATTKYNSQGRGHRLHVSLTKLICCKFISSHTSSSTLPMTCMRSKCSKQRIHNYSVKPQSPNGFKLIVSIWMCVRTPVFAWVLCVWRTIVSMCWDCQTTTWINFAWLLVRVSFAWGKDI